MKTRTATCRRIFLAYVGLIFVCPAWAQNGKRVGIGELPTALASARPGDVLVIQNGEYSDRQLSLAGTGAAHSPIVIKAETAGGVIFSGRSSLKLDGDGITLDGLYFRNGHSPNKDVIRIEGSHCKLVNSVIENFNPSNPESEERKWVSLFGSNHIVENCTFRGKRSKSVTLTVWREPGKEDNHLIQGNHFIDRPKGKAPNGYETIRIGTSDESQSPSGTRVIGNLFEACDGEIEVVSVKAGNVVVRGNTFSECAGTLTLRHGDKSIAENNLFIGKRKKETGGIRIYGSGHRITGNVAIGTTGRAGGVFAFMTGTENASLNGYHAASQLVVEGNLAVANEGPAFLLDAEFDAKKRSVLPSGIVFRSNVLASDDPQTLISGLERVTTARIQWEKTNEIYSGSDIPRHITRKISPPLTKDNVGAPWYRGRM